MSRNVPSSVSDMDDRTLRRLRRARAREQFLATQQTPSPPTGHIDVTHQYPGTDGLFFVPLYTVRKNNSVTTHIQSVYPPHISSTHGLLLSIPPEFLLQHACFQYTLF
ncbi:unnamed protein product, partial [Sphacelaria rigidula]